MRRWPEKGLAKESWLGPGYALQSLPHCSSTVLLRNQRACVGIGTNLGFHEGGTSTRHATISRIRHVSVKCQAMATRVGMFLSRSPCFQCPTLKALILNAFLFSFSLEMGTKSFTSTWLNIQAQTYIYSVHQHCLQGVCMTSSQ